MPLFILILYIGTFFFLSPVLALLLARLIKFLSRSLNTLDFIPPTVLAMVFLFAYLAYVFGSPEILGAFTVGLALSRRFALPFGLFLKTDEHMAELIEKNPETPCLGHDAYILCICRSSVKSEGN
jgi:Kef-type K+ transport system membrane component KefB